MNGRIHFLSTGPSDCIIIESNGKFAMVDSGEDTEYPPNKPLCKLQGFEEQVCEYLLKNCADENGSVTLEFVLGTHCHSDHIGGFDTVINHPNITVKKAYLKPYHEEGINSFERTQWDNLEVYTQMRDALNKNNVPIVTEFDETIEKLGDLNIKFYNGKYEKHHFKTGENTNSVVTLVEDGVSRVLLAGDMNFHRYGKEKSIGKKVGKVDLLKVGHHCYEGSSSPSWLKSLKPNYAVITNSKKKADSNVLRRIKKYGSTENIYLTVDSNGVIAEMTGKGIGIKTNIM